jgi:vitamin B12 transporter
VSIGSSFHRHRVRASRSGGSRSAGAWVLVVTTCVTSRARAAEPEVSEVEVVGDTLRDPVGPRDPAVAGSLLPRARLAGPGLEAQDVLRTQPGVVVTESGGYGAPATAAIRGATAADTPVYLAGVRLNDDVGGTADLSLVPLWLIDHAEVYRGNAPLEADRLGAGGAIFFEPRVPSREMGGVGYYGGSWGASKGWAYQGFRSGSASALVGISGDRATNRYPFRDDHGELFEPGLASTAIRQNADESTLEGWALAHAEVGRASVDVLANGIAREQGVPSLALLPTRRAREQADRTLASVQVRVPVGAKDGVTLDARTSVLVGRTVFDDPLLELALYTRRLSIEGRRVEQSIGATLERPGGWRLRPQINLAHEEITRSPDTIPLGHAHRDFARAALGAEDPLASWLTAHALASAECHDTGAGSGPCDVLEPTGRVGVVVGDDRVRAVANAGRYVRVPTLGEVYGASGTIHGNPLLAPESGYTFDLGVRLQTGHGPLAIGAYVDAFAFGRWVSGLIAYERSGQGYVTPYNVGSARVLGAEVLAGVAPLKGWRVEVAATALDPRDTTPTRTTVNDVLPYRSRFIAGPRIRGDWKRKSSGGLSALGGEIAALYQSSRYVDSAGLGVIPEQAAVDAEVDASWFDGLLTARLRVADIFDSTRTDIVGYPLPGRSAYFGLETAW